MNTHTQLRVTTKFVCISKLTLLLAAAALSVACGQSSSDSFGQAIAPPTSESPAPNPQLPGEGPKNPGEGPEEEMELLVLNQVATIRSLVNGVLEAEVTLPMGTQIEIPVNSTPDAFEYRGTDGKVERSSTGFIAPIYIVSVPRSSLASFPQSRIDDLNARVGGLYISASFVPDIAGVSGAYAAVAAATPGAGFLAYFQSTGKPKFSYTTSLTKRFPKMNQGVDPASLSAFDREKYEAVYRELVRAGDRTKPTEKSLLLIDLEDAEAASLEFEKSGTVPLNGAWTIAVRATAARHGFANVPCAEFMSEMVREAYQRAGYRVSDDFNSTIGNQLIWSKTAAVVNLSKALYDAGWVAWDTTKYRPMTGAIMMHASANTPGHAYMSGGHDGRLVVDNGSPQGRDLRKTVEKTVSIMYQTGIFFLPPGINPQPW